MLTTSITHRNHKRFSSTSSSFQPQLITLNYISICQQCKCKFDNTHHIPYLFKCGHFFCKQCIETAFTSAEGITCPTDGVVAYSLSELKLLYDLITDNGNDTHLQQNVNYCNIHKEEKLTHYMEDTSELFCVYCAFAKAKKNPHVEIKEIKDKHNEMLNELNCVLEDEQRYVKMIQGGLSEIKRKKDREEKKVNVFYEQMISYYKNKQKEDLIRINLLFTENERKLSCVLEEVSKRIEKCEKLKNVIIHNTNNNDNESKHSFLDIIEQFNILIKTHMPKYKDSTHLNDYHFIHEDETTLTKLMNTFTNIQNSSKSFLTMFASTK